MTMLPPIVGLFQAVASATGPSRAKRPRSWWQRMRAAASAADHPSDESTCATASRAHPWADLWTPRRAERGQGRGLRHKSPRDVQRCPRRRARESAAGVGWRPSVGTYLELCTCSLLLWDRDALLWLHGGRREEAGGSVRRGPLSLWLHAAPRRRHRGRFQAPSQNITFARYAKQKGPSERRRELVSAGAYRGDAARASGPFLGGNEIIAAAGPGRSPSATVLSLYRYLRSGACDLTCAARPSLSLPLAPLRPASVAVKSPCLLKPEPCRTWHHPRDTHGNGQADVFLTSPRLASSWRSFWHTMTSNDRHASHDSPYRTGQHVPLPQSRHAPLTSVATSAMESRTDLASPYPGDDPASGNGYSHSPKGPLSPKAPYSPGLRSVMSRQSADADAFSDKSPTGEIPMQSFSDGLPPPPPVSHSWKRIDHWAESHYEELFDNLCEGCTQNDVNELEHELDCTLPMDVRESLQVHDGQERPGLPTGIIFGCMLLDCEEILLEWQNWRKVNDEYLTQRSFNAPQPPMKAFGGAPSSAASSSSAPPLPQQPSPTNSIWRQDLLSRQDSQPPGAVQKAYAHPAWIPLARDWGGNCLAVDLAPGANGRWGQIIIFGRDYDCKYVVARSWGAFLATLADDLSSDKVHVDEDSNELKLLEFKRQNVEPPYLEILRWRCDQKHGRKAPRRRPNGPGAAGLRINSSVGGTGLNNGSPYASPTTSLGEERGRSPHRFSGAAGKVPAGSPRAHLSSPLARVAEEAPKPIRVHTGGSTKEEKLVSIDTPRPSEDRSGIMSPLRETTNVHDANKKNVNGSKTEEKDVADNPAGMKTVEI
ncbi:hypothetical protein BDY21DRAFT_364096 [Lineolata rhizophorae]|uniref:Knr4/Smi1-like domain-containing protein n=1 Tax=Lineolata rhizophorae TaxID=578093 RepID=A0A6A6NZK7_9PEZI|nr:hypothetical protein BDY21DRAFT_364096 [Lineolata rhizophorae]